MLFGGIFFDKPRAPPTDKELTSLRETSNLYLSEDARGAIINNIIYLPEGPWASNLFKTIGWGPLPPADLVLKN